MSVSAAKWIDVDRPVYAQALSEDEALLQIGDEKFVMTYDSLYVLALRVAGLLDQMESAPAVSPTPQ